MKRTENSDNNISRRSAWVGVLMLILAAAMLEATTLIQYFFAQRALDEEASSRAETQLDATRTNICISMHQAKANKFSIL